MNRYGRMAHEHTRQHRPAAFASMDDPVAHFTRLGEEVADRITQLRDELVGPLRPEKNLEGYRRLSYQARRQAEELLLAEMVWLPVEETVTTAENDEVLAHRVQLASISAALATADRDWTATAAEAPTAP
jgi:hypothetical protein